MPEGILSHCPDLGAFCIIHVLNTMQKKKSTLLASPEKNFLSARTIVGCTVLEKLLNLTLNLYHLQEIPISPGGRRN